jgi:hypothetical protein
VRWERPAGSVLFALSGVVLALVGLVLGVAPPAWSIGMLAGDDAGYYLAIARNYCLGHGLSFDRLHPTNGFNPLLSWLLIPTFRLLPADLPLVDCYRAGVLLGFAAIGIALVVFMRSLAAALDPRVFSGGLRHLALGAGAAFFVLFVATKGFYGMDAPLVLMLGLLYLWRTQRGGPLAPGPAAAATDGLLLGLLFLARVDTLPLLVAAFAVMICEWVARGRGGRALAARLAVTSLVCLPYLVWSTVTFGTWLPVSARLKSSFPVVDLTRSLGVIRNTSLHLVDQASFLVAGLLACGTVVVLARHVARARRARAPLEPGIAALGVLALYLIGRLTYMLLFSRADVQGSYGILAHVFNVLVVAVAGGAWLRRREARDPAVGRRVAALAAGALGLLAIVLFAGKLQAALGRAPTVVEQRLPDETVLGAEIHARTGSGDVIFGGSFGMLGFFADRAWINGDGVVNTYHYQRVFLEPGARGAGGLEDYLAANRVTHVVFLVPRDADLGAGPIPIRARSLLYERTNSTDVFAKDIVLRRTVSRGPPGGSDFILARWRP